MISFVTGYPGDGRYHTTPNLGSISVKSCYVKNVRSKTKIEFTKEVV